VRINETRQGFRTRGGTFRSSSDPGDGTRVPGASTTADRAGFRHVFSDPRCLFSRDPRLHDTLIPQRVSSASRRLALANVCPRQEGRWHESACRLLDSLRGKQRNRAAFEGLPRDSGSVPLRDARSHHTSFKPRERVAETYSAAEHAGSPELPSSPASQEPSRPVTASQYRASFAWRLRLFDHFACVGERCLPIAIRSFRGFHPAPVPCGPHSVSAKKSRISM
jgi:hypothetical protein